MPPSLTYLICATPRSGSTLLCEALRNTGLAGRPDEYFGPMHVSRWNEQWHTSTADEYLARVFREGRTPNGVWGAKLMRVYWHDLIDQLRDAEGCRKLNEQDLLQRVFDRPRYVFITRRNKVRQAVSWLKFVQGSAWYWECDTPQRLDGLHYQEEVIDQFIRDVGVQESAWTDYFDRIGVKPHVVVYEELCDAYEPTAAAVLDHLGIEHERLSIESKRRLKRQADDLSEQWTRRYLESRGSSPGA